MNYFINKEENITDNVEIMALKAALAAKTDLIEKQRKVIKDLQTENRHDSMTGVLNRRGFDEAVRDEQARIARLQSRGSILMLMDVDNFKHINDTHGHAAGDACLAHLVEIVRKLVRDNDHLCRVGGDEFALLLNNTNENLMGLRLSHIKTQLRNLSVELDDGTRLGFSASCGFSFIHAASYFDAVFEKADKALYQSKAKFKAVS